MEIRFWSIFFNFANVLRLIENWSIEKIEILKGSVSERVSRLPGKPHPSHP